MFKLKGGESKITIVTGLSYPAEEKAWKATSL
jgi:hypothetical protein